MTQFRIDYRCINDCSGVTLQSFALIEADNAQFAMIDFFNERLVPYDMRFLTLQITPNTLLPSSLPQKNASTPQSIYPLSK
jgi:hypothetical protein